jgi:hypothetical protein
LAHLGPKEETTIVDSIVVGTEQMRRPRTPEQVTSDWLMSPMPPSPELDFNLRSRRTPFNPFELCELNRDPPFHRHSSIAQISPKSSPTWSPERHTPELRDATPPADDKLRHKPWITENILDMIRVRDRLYQKMKSEPTVETIQTYKKVRNMVVSMTRNAKRTYEKNRQNMIFVSS